MASSQVKKIKIDPLPDGRVIIQAEPADREITNALGILSLVNKDKITLTVDEINEVSRDGWAGIGPKDYLIMPPWPRTRAG